MGDVDVGAVGSNGTAGSGGIDFGLGRLKVVGKTARLELPMLWPDTVLVGRPAMQENVAFFSRKVRSRSQRITSPQLAAEKSREEDLDLYAEHVLTDWSGVYDKAGNAVKFSVGAAKELLRQLPSYLFDRVRFYFQDADAFLAPSDDGAGVAKELAGKSTAG